MENHLAPFKLLPVAPGKCPKCAVAHEPEMPHDNRSLFYQYHFYGLHGYWPTWDDAMEHCPENIKEATRDVVAML